MTLFIISILLLSAVTIPAASQEQPLPKGLQAIAVTTAGTAATVPLPKDLQATTDTTAGTPAEATTTTTAEAPPPALPTPLPPASPLPPPPALPPGDDPSGEASVQSSYCIPIQVSKQPAPLAADAVKSSLLSAANVSPGTSLALAGSVPLVNVQEVCQSNRTRLNVCSFPDAVAATTAEDGVSNSSNTQPQFVSGLEATHLECGSDNNWGAVVKGNVGPLANAQFVVDCSNQGPTATPSDTTNCALILVEGTPTSSSGAEAQQPQPVAPVLRLSNTPVKALSASVAATSNDLGSCRVDGTSCSIAGSQVGCGDGCLCVCPTNITCACQNGVVSANDPDPPPPPPPPSKSCFPGKSTVLRRARPDCQAGQCLETVRVADLQIGDEIQVVLPPGHLGWSKVHVIPHREHAGINPYYTIATASGHTLQLSHGHYIYHAPSPASTWAERVPVPGRDVQPGVHVMWVTDETTQQLVQSPVVATDIDSEQGAFVIWTVEGSAVVDGVAPSPYTDTFGSETAMHLVSTTCSIIWKLLGDRHAKSFSVWMHEQDIVDGIVWVLKSGYRSVWGKPSKPSGVEVVTPSTAFAASAGVGAAAGMQFCLSGASVVM